MSRTKHHRQRHYVDGDWGNIRYRDVRGKMYLAPEKRGGKIKKMYHKQYRAIQKQQLLKELKASVE